MPVCADRPMVLLCWLVAFAAMSVFAGDATDAGTLRVDFAKSLKEIRALHGGNCGPLQYGEITDLSASFRELGKAIKARWPELKVGGPSLGYTGQIKDGRFEPGEFLVKFLERCRDRKLPLDFFSWHLYTDNPAECMTRARGLRELLDRTGFAKTELHFNEWNSHLDRKASACAPSTANSAE